MLILCYRCQVKSGAAIISNSRNPEEDISVIESVKKVFSPKGSIRPPNSLQVQSPVITAVMEIRSLSFTAVLNVTMRSDGCSPSTISVACLHRHCILSFYPFREPDSTEREEDSDDQSQNSNDSANEEGGRSPRGNQESDDSSESSRSGGSSDEGNDSAPSAAREIVPESVRSVDRVHSASIVREPLPSTSRASPPPPPSQQRPRLIVKLPFGNFCVLFLVFLIL